ncbi:MAG: M16 family metallopeptidase [cyanobacterium endosymbiont of Rhopalodia sterrenbergii]
MQKFQETSSQQSPYYLKLDNGITIILRKNSTADLISGRIFIKNSGGLWESREKNGLFHLLTTVITKGTDNLSAVEIAEAVESIGANLGVNATADYLVIGLKAVSSDFQEMLALVGEILRVPIFPEAEVALEKKLICQSIRSQQEQLLSIAFNQLRATIYGDHPYGTSILGKEETVTNLTRKDLQCFHKNHFRPDNLIISLSGFLNIDYAISWVEKIFGDWSIPNNALSIPTLPNLEVSPCDKFSFQETQQSIVMLGYLTAEVHSPDYHVLKLLSTYLGNGLSSRLFMELREKKGLAYDVSAIYSTHLKPSQFVVYMGTAAHNTTIAIEQLQQEVKRLSYQELTPQELQATKNKLLGQYALSKQTNSEIANLYGRYETLGLGIKFDREFQDQINQVTSQMIQTVSNKYLLHHYVSVVGPNPVETNN